MHDFRLLLQTKKTYHEIKKHNNIQEKTLGCCYTFHWEIAYHQTWIKLPKSGDIFSFRSNFCTALSVNCWKAVNCTWAVAQDPGPKWGERRKHGQLNKWHWCDTLMKLEGCFALFWQQGLQKDCCASQNNTRTQHDPAHVSAMLPLWVCKIWSRLTQQHSSSEHS